MSKRRTLLVGVVISAVAAMAAACGTATETESQPTTVQASPAVTTDVATSTAIPPTATPTVEPAPTPAPTETPQPSAVEVPGQEEPEPQLAPELTRPGEWINSEPFTLESQRGTVVLIDFWTYTCINCIRTLPYLKEWHEKYADAGLVILGVHTPEFDFEKVYDNVLEAVEGFGIEYAVVQDNDYGTWRAFRNRFWPAKYMIDKDGYIRYTHFGEGAYVETEAKIRELLLEAGADLEGMSMNLDADPAIDPSAYVEDISMSLTRELYAGFGRNQGALVGYLQGNERAQPPYIIDQQYYEANDVDGLYTDQGDHRNHFMYLQGLWRNEDERLVHARETTDYEDYIAIMFYATSVNVVMAPESDGPFAVRLTIDGLPMAAEQAGPDVMFDEEGNSYVLVDEAQMYRLVDQPTFSGHEFRLSSNSSEFTLFAFTFGAYMGGEPKS